MTTEEVLMDRLMTALKKLAAVKSWRSDIAVADVRVSWHSGSSTTGYKELADAITQMIQLDWSNLRDRAIIQLENDCPVARKDLRAFYLDKENLP